MTGFVFFFVVFLQKKKMSKCRDKFTLKRAPVARQLFIEPTVAGDTGAVCLAFFFFFFPHMCALVLGARTSAEVAFRRAEERSAREKVAELASMPKANKETRKRKARVFI